MAYNMSPFKKRLIRIELTLSQNGCCGYCDRRLSFDQKDSRKARFATLDHLHPIALGGSNDRKNLILCCRLCNSVKGHSTLEEFIFGLFWYWVWKNHPVLTFEWSRRSIVVDAS